MDKEFLRMQMLSGVITESKYKAKLAKLAKLEEGAFDNPFTPKPAEPQKGGGLQLKNAAMKVYSYIKKNGFNTFLTVDGKNVGDRMNHDFSIQVSTKAGQGEGLLVIQGNKNKTNPQVVEKLQNDIIHDFPFLKKSNQTNPSQLTIKLEVDPKANVSESLNENFVGMGMVGNIFDREKTDYELAFEHFTKGTSLNEKMDGEMPKAPSHEETDAAQVYEAEENFIKGDETVKNQLKTYFEEMAKNYPENLASVLTGLVMGEDPTFKDFISRASKDISGDDNPFGVDSF